MLKIRPHHLLCLSRRECPKGWYTKELKKHAKEIRARIQKNPEMKIRLVKRCEDVCIKCPYHNKGVCVKRPKINYWIIVMDNKVLRKIKIEEDSVHTAKDIFNLTIGKIGDEDLKKICKGCEFLKYCLELGLKRSFVRKLRLS